MASPSEPPRDKAPSKGKRKASDRLNPSKWFSSSKQIEAYATTFCKRTLITPKYTNLLFFEVKNFNFPKYYLDQNLKTLLEMNGPIYPDLIRVFYTNLTTKNGLLKSEVKGVTFALTPAVWKAITGLKCEGARITGENCPWPGFNGIETYRSCCRESVRSLPKKLLTGPFTPDDRLLHFMLAWIIAPRASNHAQITNVDLQLIYGIKNGLQIDWPFIIQQQMLKAQVDSDLPYAILISRIIDYFDVNLIEEGEMSLQPSSLIEKSTLKRMHIDFLDGAWQYKSNEEDAPEDDNDQPTLQLILDKLDGLQTSFNDFREENRQQLTNLDTRMTNLEALIRNPNP